VNVTNVPLSLKEWSLDTRLLGRKALVASLTRHYFGQALAEAHKALAPCPAPATPAGWYVSNAARLDQAVSARARTAALGRARRPRDANRPIW